MSDKETQDAGERVLDAADRAGLTVASPDMGYGGFTFELVRPAGVFRVTVAPVEEE